MEQFRIKRSCECVALKLYVSVDYHVTRLDNMSFKFTTIARCQYIPNIASPVAGIPLGAE